MGNKLKISITIIIILLLGLISFRINSFKISNQSPEAKSQAKTYDLIKYKDSYVGDNSSVGNIISRLPANAYNTGFSLQTSKKPYGITINYKAIQDLKEKDYNNFLEKNAAVLFFLIQNADFVEFNVENINEKSYKYNRKNLEEKYGINLKKLFTDDISIKKFLNS
ncbi:MAG: DUF4825 domain-containing protein [Clostridium sp.]|jgi:hypothetical protein|uniref:DUF4825 domain-containing protein n=1 Tax=Clostridium sp. TaxID=1506 RepID=UPI0025BEF2D0|nr:DUF4825 domain-containing protein [Clostridium sp.]MCH3963377.1 DUF4825 domain-containing protein [Clostridium sp.]MCI1716755.1 DUF4825 domain-containing protein [Clostridium sp.]MCI1801061.1 DUF4825 domain-containing protein [Clostridium sp.]MCI1814941.1 DUF4825 domain-containing protein [Clostridium sp.]MCI1871842.1 DUF4825 domain-containing protein [Clostridium sp.]